MPIKRSPVKGTGNLLLDFFCYIDGLAVDFIFLPSRKDPMPRWLFTTILVFILLIIGFGIGTEYVRRTTPPLIPDTAKKLVPTIETKPEVDFANHFARLHQRLEQIETRLGQIENSKENQNQQLPVAQSTPTERTDQDLGKKDAPPRQNCTALTKAGKRCKRKAQSGRDRCWQH